MPRRRSRSAASAEDALRSGLGEPGDEHWYTLIDKTVTASRLPGALWWCDTATVFRARTSPASWRPQSETLRSPYAGWRRLCGDRLKCGRTPPAALQYAEDYGAGPVDRATAGRRRSSGRRCSTYRAALADRQHTAILCGFGPQQFWRVNIEQGNSAPGDRVIGCRSSGRVIRSAHQLAGTYQRLTGNLRRSALTAARKAVFAANRRVVGGRPPARRAPRLIPASRVAFAALADSASAARWCRVLPDSGTPSSPAAVAMRPDAASSIAIAAGTSRRRTGASWIAPRAQPRCSSYSQRIPRSGARSAIMLDSTTILSLRRRSSGHSAAMPAVEDPGASFSRKLGYVFPLHVYKARWLELARLTGAV